MTGAQRLKVGNSKGGKVGGRKSGKKRSDAGKKRGPNKNKRSDAGIARGPNNILRKNNKMKQTELLAAQARAKKIFRTIRA
eukprot:COSAG01_NODE_2345_length_7860_cov_23.900528_8_plen_81_part_00